MLMLSMIVFTAALVVAFALTYVAYKYVLNRAILDNPNGRSLHTVPTPRGGGVAIAVTFLAGTALLYNLGFVSLRLTAALTGGALITLIGWIDDSRGGLSATVRLIAQIGAAAWAVCWLGGIDGLWFGDGYLKLGLAGSLLSVLGIVWCINLYNFMDGIDGIAAGEAVSVGLLGAYLILLRAKPDAVLLPMLLAGASCGFLIWNWAPAKIFMGDAGSGFLGFVFATIAISTEQTRVLPLFAWVLIAGVFLFDATATLLRRVVRREAWYTAHRTHAYQRLVLAGWSHRRVAASVWVVNVLLASTAAGAVLGAYDILVAAAIGTALVAGCYIVVERLSPMPPNIMRTNTGTDD